MDSCVRKSIIRQHGKRLLQQALNFINLDASLWNSNWEHTRFCDDDREFFVRTYEKNGKVKCLFLNFKTKKFENEENSAYYDYEEDENWSKKREFVGLAKKKIREGLSAYSTELLLTLL